MNTLIITEELKQEITDLWNKYHNYIVIAKHIKQKSNFNFYYSLDLTINLLKKWELQISQD